MSRTRGGRMPPSRPTRFIGQRPANRVVKPTGVPRSSETSTPHDPTEGPCLGSYGGPLGTYGDPWGVGVSYERGTPVGRRSFKYQVSTGSVKIDSTPLPNSA
jgi:hypothetical protein